MPVPFFRREGFSFLPFFLCGRLFILLFYFIRLVSFVILALGLSDEKYHLIILVLFCFLLYFFCFNVTFLWTVGPFKEIYYLVVFPLLFTVNLLYNLW